MLSFLGQRIAEEDDEGLSTHFEIVDAGDRSDVEDVQDG